MDKVDQTGQAGINITMEMIRASVRILRESGVVEHEGLINESLLRRVLVGALSQSQVSVYVDGKLCNPSPVEVPKERDAEPSTLKVQRKAVFPVSEGDVTFVFPETLTVEGIEELEAYLNVFLKKEKRIAQSKPS